MSISKFKVIFFIIISLTIFLFFYLNLIPNFDINKILANFLKSLGYENKEDSLRFNKVYSFDKTKNYNSKVIYKEESEINLNNYNFTKDQIFYKETLKAINFRYDKRSDISRFLFENQFENRITLLLPTSSEDNFTSKENTVNNPEDSQENEEDDFRKGGEFDFKYIKDSCQDYKNKFYPKVLISEVKIASEEDSKDEFIELYFPSENNTAFEKVDLDLTCWSLEKYSSRTKENKDPSLTVIIPNSKFKGKIKPNGFFLITSSSTKDKYQADLFYPESYYLSKNNVLILKNPNGEIVDLIGFGEEVDKIFKFETHPFLGREFKNK